MRSSIDDDFADFHRDNPHVLQSLIRLAREERAQGRRRIGVKALVERLRWSSLQTTGVAFKLDNRLTSRYARAIQEAAPDVADMFTTRALTTEPVPVPMGQLELAVIR